MVRTGASAYVKYGFETSYGAVAANTVNKSFGLQDKMSSLTLTNNKVNLAKLNQNTVDRFAYGQQSGSASVSFTLSNPWLFGMVLSPPVRSGSAGSRVFTWQNSTLLPEARTVQIEVGIDDSTNMTRTLKGGIVGAVALSTSVGGLVDCSTDITYGQETAPSTALSAPILPSVQSPYTFAHAELTFAGSVVAQCQDVSLNLSQNAELLYGLNSHSAVDAYKKVLDITGSFKAAWVDKVLLEHLLDQLLADGTGETIGGSSELEFKLTFTKSATESITINCYGLTLNDLGLSGLEPVEVLFSDASFTAKTIKVVANSTMETEDG
tara:strand:+ start:2265 stop:3233 length:969 start_codon:yes stop_codon:yes gene_type:complete